MADLYGDLSAAAIVAEASGKAPGKTNWTVLALYYFATERLAVSHGAVCGRFVAEIVGETTVDGQERRVRRASFATLAKALNWGAFDAKSALYQELHRKALAWMEAQAKDIAAGGDGNGLVPVRFGGTAGGLERPDVRTPAGTAASPAIEAASRRAGPSWDGGEHGTFREALMWLYEPVTTGVSEAVHLFVADWAATPETIGEFGGGFYYANGEITAAHVFAVLDFEEDRGLTPWAETFCRAMRHFKREEFHARKR